MKTHPSLPAVFAAFLLLTTLSAQTATPLDEARAALKAGDLPKAESLLTPLTGPEAKDAAAFHALGQLRERQRNLKDAAAAYEQATKLDAAQADYFASLGVALSQRMGELNFMQQAMYAGKMKKAFEKAVELDPKHLGGLIGLARYYTNAPEIAGGSLEKARGLAARIGAIRPDLGATEYGAIAEKDENFAEALTHYEKLVTLRPGQGWPHYLCGRTLARLGRKDEARTRFETALQLDPKLEAAQKALTELAAPAA